MNTAKMPSIDMMSMIKKVTCAGHQTNHFATFARCCRGDAAQNSLHDVVRVHDLLSLS